MGAGRKQGEPATPSTKLIAAGTGDSDVEVAARAIAKMLDVKQVIELAWKIGTEPGDAQVARLWGEGMAHEKGESVAVAYANRVLRTLGATIDLAGDDGALVFAKRTQDHLAKNRTCWIASIASYALAHRAKRRKEAFPRGFYPLLHKASDDLSYGLHYDHNIREIVDTIAVADREKFLDDFGFQLQIYECEDKKNGRTVEVPTLIKAWAFIDLIPSAKVMQAVVDEIAETGEKLPKEQLLEVFKRFGPQIVPLLAKAITAKAKNKAFLAQALKAAGSARARA
jgi:hypothetical protein